MILTVNKIIMALASETQWALTMLNMVHMYLGPLSNLLILLHSATNWLIFYQWSTRANVEYVYALSLRVINAIIFTAPSMAPCRVHQCFQMRMHKLCCVYGIIATSHMLSQRLSLFVDA